jgi:hypothetical protein
VRRLAALAIGIPRVLVLKSPVAVFWVICGAALAIAGVWLSGQSKAGQSKTVESNAKKIADPEAMIEDLKERLENVEVINHYETTLAERALEAESEVGTSDLPGRESSMEEK